MPREMKYETAMRQLETIAEKMENGELDIDSLCEQLKTAQKLIKMCKDKLTSTEENIKKVECIDYPELGMEAVWKIEVEDFPAFILVDNKGNDFFKKLM